MFDRFLVLEDTKWTSSSRHLSISGVIIWGRTLHAESHNISLQTIVYVSHKIYSNYDYFKKIDINYIWCMYMNRCIKSGHVQLQCTCDKQSVDKLLSIDLELGAVLLPPFSECTTTHASALYNYICSSYTRLQTIRVCKKQSHR